MTKVCNNCNPMLGHGKDDPVILRKAADYLEQHLGGDAYDDEEIALKY